MSLPGQNSGFLVKAIKRLFRTNRRLFFAVASLAAIVGCCAAYFSIELTSTVAFCTSCHEMKQAGESLLMSKHANVPPEKGRNATCRDCHLPPWNHPVRLAVEKAFHGAKDVTRHFTDADEFDEQGYYFAMKVNAAKTVHNYNCLKCHADLFGKKYEGRANLHATLCRNPRFNCVSCHEDVAHREYLPREIR